MVYLFIATTAVPLPDTRLLVGASDRVPPPKIKEITMQPVYFVTDVWEFQPHTRLQFGHIFGAVLEALRSAYLVRTVFMSGAQNPECFEHMNVCHSIVDSERARLERIIAAVIDTFASTNGARHTRPKPAAGKVQGPRNYSQGLSKCIVLTDIRASSQIIVEFAPLQCATAEADTVNIQPSVGSQN